MPTTHPTLSVADVATSIARRAVVAPTGVAKIGLELEWLTFDPQAPRRRVHPDEIAAAVAATTLPHGGAVTVEPGGQVELSSPPLPSLCAAIDATLTDATALRRALAAAGIATAAEPVDHDRPPDRVLDTPRYAAMEAFFAGDGPAGRSMMCNTASMQVNVDAPGDPAIAWRAAEAVARALPELVNTGHRAAIWSAIDPTRTAAVGGDDPGEAWARYALDARVMFLRVGAERCEPQLDGLTLRRWISEGHPLGWPTADDVDEHLTTLFPPVRPRGFLEIRSLDAFDDDTWPAVAATAAASVLDFEAANAIVDLESVGCLDGEALIAIAGPAVGRLGAPQALVARVAELAEGVHACR